MGRQKLDPVEKITRLLNDAALATYDLPFNAAEVEKLTDSIWVISEDIKKKEQDRKERLLRKQSGCQVMSFEQPPMVQILSVSAHTVIIQCPYCGQKHIHGRISGHVVAHCLDKSVDNCGYVIPELKK